MALFKCGHCRRRPPGRKTTIKATDGSRLVSCSCGKVWLRKAKKDQRDDQRGQDLGNDRTDGVRDRTPADSSLRV